MIIAKVVVVFAGKIELFRYPSEILIINGEDMLLDEVFGLTISSSSDPVRILIKQNPKP